MADPTQLGHAGLKGWRKLVADRVAGPAAARLPLDEDQVRAAVGALFFVLSVVYVVTTARDMLRGARG